MTDEDEYSVDSAREASRRDQLGAWVERFLASPGSDNAELGALLTGSPRWWSGPLKLPIDQLNRLAGPPGEPVLTPVADDDWRDDVDQMAEQIERGWEPPPVIVSYREGQLVLEDGNHRVESIRRADRDHAWAIIGFDDPESRERFIAPPAG
ncbi:MAG: ParB N-terminal domain-containing protein [Acidimicrobiia bacterium]|nr:ParB N-terminal domain-containing protein [Acidimicrobiia bacterium]